MAGSGPPAHAEPVTPALSEADLRRRRLVVRGLSLASVLLTVATFVMLVFLRVHLELGLVTLAATAGFGAAFLVARRGPRVTWAAGLLLGTSLVQHVLSALLVPSHAEAADAVLFSALVPLVAAATVGVRGTALTSWLAAAVPVLVGALLVARGGAPEEVIRGLAPKAFLVWIAGALGVMLSRATRRSLLDQSRQDLERERAQAEAVAASGAARAAERRMEAVVRLAGGVVHDFNNLIAVVGASAQLARDALPAVHPATAELDAIDEVVERARAMARQLLAIARQQPLPEEAAVPSLVVARLEPLLRRAVGPGVTLELDVAASGWSVGLGPSQLEQVVTNLVVNARDALPEGGRIRITASDQVVPSGEVRGLPGGEHVVIAVTDDGTGIEPDVLERLFEPFFTTKPEGKGTGLGLSTSFGAAQQVSGTIAVESAVGRGTTFRVYLPRVAVTGRAQARAAESRPAV